MTAATTRTESLVQRAYLRDLPEWQAKGWEPCRDDQGRIVVMGSPTGTQLYIVQKEAS